MSRLEAAPAGADLWLLDVVRGAATRFTDDPSWDVNPVWSPDGHRIVFSSDRIGTMNLYLKALDDPAKEELLLESAWQKRANDWSPDGRTIVYQTKTPRWELWQLTLSGDRKPVPLVKNNFNNMLGTFSPTAGGWRTSLMSQDAGKSTVNLSVLRQANGFASRSMEESGHAGGQMVKNSFTEIRTIGSSP